MGITKIISGGQAGADQAGLDVAIKHNIPHGGAIPKGRMTEDGVLDQKYNLTEMTTKSYPKRIEQNVLDSDGTVIFTHGTSAESVIKYKEMGICFDFPAFYSYYLDHQQYLNTQIIRDSGKLNIFLQSFFLE